MVQPFMGELTFFQKWINMLIIKRHEQSWQMNMFHQQSHIFPSQESQSGES